MLKVSAYKLPKNGDAPAEWRGIVLRCPTGQAGKIAWSAPDVRLTRAAAMGDAEAHLRPPQAKEGKP
jgi:hypothetical protein